MFQKTLTHTGMKNLNHVNLFSVKKNPSLRILHVTNFNERHDGRLFLIPEGELIMD